MNSKWWIGQDKEESGDNPADVQCNIFHSELETIITLRSETGTLLMQVRSFTTTTAYSVGCCGECVGLSRKERKTNSEYDIPVLRTVMVLYSRRNDCSVHGSSSCEISSSSDSEEIANKLVNPKVHHRVHESTPSFPVVSLCNYVLSVK